MKPNLRRYNIEGAPFHIGMLVVVTCAIDEAADVTLIGKQGRIVYYEYDCGCAQTFPNDPMIGVELDGKVHEFWFEELKEDQL